MAESPDQFQRTVRVRLPIADRFLGKPAEAAAATVDLRKAFRRPLLHVRISPQAGTQAAAPNAKGIPDDESLAGRGLPGP